MKIMNPYVARIGVGGKVAGPRPISDDEYDPVTATLINERETVNNGLFKPRGQRTTITNGACFESLSLNFARARSVKLNRLLRTGCGTKDAIIPCHRQVHAKDGISWKLADCSKVERWRHYGIGQEQE